MRSLEAVIRAGFERLATVAAVAIAAGEAGDAGKRRMRAATRRGSQTTLSICVIWDVDHCKHRPYIDRAYLSISDEGGDLGRD